MQDKNFIAFLVMSVLLIFLWMTFFAPKPKHPPGGKPGETTTTQGGNTAVPPVVPGSTTPTPTALPGATPPAVTAAGTTAPTAPGVPVISTTPATTAAAQPPPPPAAERFTVKTDLYEIEFDSAGAAPIHWRLQNYSNEKCFPVKVVLTWPPIIRNPPCNPAPVDLVDPGLPANTRFFMSQNVIDGMTISPSTTWKAESKVLDFQSGNTADVVFDATLRDGRMVKKIFRLNRKSYLSELLFKVEGAAPKTASSDLGIFFRWDPQGRKGAPSWNFIGPLYFFYKNAEKTQYKMSHIEPQTVVKSDLVAVEKTNWAGFTGEYFLTAALAPDTQDFNFTVKFMGTAEDKSDKKAPKVFAGWAQAKASPEDLAAGLAGRFLVFMGPKDKKVLVPLRPTLKYAIDYGRLGLLVEPLIWCLVKTESLVGNYGLAIVIVTIILRMLMFPLTRKSQKSMKEIQKLQPEIAKIKERYPDDRVKQQEETQALWRKHKINPAMGCLPVLLQFPVFMAFYKALLISIELRQAPFFSWVQDLGARDPLYIWPVLMGATQVVTQKLTPTQMDPTQAKIFLFMPLIFMFILKDFPSGLLIYWTVQNLVGIGQQIYVNKTTD